MGGPVTNPDDVVLVTLGTHTYRTLSIDAPTLSHGLRGLAGYLEGPDGSSYQFDSLTHSPRNGRAHLLVDLSSREYRLHH